MMGFRMLGMAKGLSYGVVLGVAFAVVATGLAQGAGKSRKSRVASGTYAVSNSYSATPQGGAAIASLTYKGALTGTGIDSGTEVISSGGFFSAHGTEFCDPCTIDGKTGAFTATYKISASPGKFSGTETFTRGFGKLAGLTGGGTFTVNTYRYSYRF